MVKLQSKETSSEIKKPAAEAISKSGGNDIYLPHLAALTAGLEALKADTKMNDVELKSVRSLVAYVAYRQEANEIAVEEIISNRFGVSSVNELPQNSYDDVVQFLVDLQVSQQIN